MKKYNKTYEEALEFVRNKRSCVNLNKNFASELQKLELMDI
jgi:hypothetical protein